MGKCFRITYSLNLTEVGSYPQVEEAIYPIPPDNPDASAQLWFQKADLKKIVYPKPVLVRRAKLTDLISCSVVGTSFTMLISDKLKSIIEDSLHREMQFVPAIIIFKGEPVTNYWFTNHYNFSQDLIDFKKSSILKTSFLNKRFTQTKIKINSYQEYIDCAKEIKPPSGLFFENLALLEPVFEEFFTLQWTYGGIFYINNDLKEKIELAKCSGIRFMGLNERV